MSSLDLSETINSSDDEDRIIASMETNSGLPRNGQGHHHTDKKIKMMESDTSVASVKMMGRVMKNVAELFDSSESEDEAIMENMEGKVKAKVNGCNNTNMVNGEDSDVHGDDLTGRGTEFSKGSKSQTSKDSVMKHSKSEAVLGFKHSTGRTGSFESEAKINSRRMSENESQFKNNRFNPFDRDLHIEEDYFNDGTSGMKPKSPVGRLKSDSTTSSWTNISDPDDIKPADLGILHDHFSQPEGYFGMSNTEELEMAIETCKDMILDAPPHSDKQKNLVKKLVQLRMKLQELKEGPEPVPDGVKVVVGHKFELKTSRGSKHYCEKCNTVIWGMLQEWYRCTECGYCAHTKCLNQITRTCASVRVQEDPTYCLSICPDRGLSSQNYRCAECRSAISFKSGYSEPRICDYSGNYYCELCHWNDPMLIPARVLHNWDFDGWKVCRASKQFLKLMESKAVIRINGVNPMLFSFVEELNEVKKLREELLIMKKYILLCSVAMEAKLLLQLQGRQHFVESSDIYTMRDLIDIHNDALLPELAQVHTSWAQHIKTDCEKCKAKGFICELCDTDEVLFPFDNIAVVCSECSCVLHRHCFAKRSGTCPRCERRNKRKET